MALILQAIGIPGQTQTSATKPAPETKKPNDKEITPPKKKPLSPAEKRSYDLLIATLDQSDQIADPAERSEIIVPAAVLLWKFDEQTSRTWLKRSINSLFEAYERYDDKESRRKNLDAIKRVAKLLASRDSTISLAIIDRLDELNQKYSQTKSNSALYRADKLAIAEGAIDTDAKQATQIASETVGSGIPTSFPGFLYKLAQTDQGQADALFRQTLSVLSTGSVSRLNDALTLSVYAFKEIQLIRPTVADLPNQKNVYTTMFLNPYPTGPPALDIAIANDYLNATNSYLASLLGPDGSGISSDKLTLGICFYLVNKAGFYAGYFNPSSNNSWQQLRSRVLELLSTAGLDPGVLASQTGYAQNLAKGEEPLKTDDGAASFDKADKATDKAERDKFLAFGIISLADAQKFDEADKKIEKVSDTALAERLHNYVNIHAGHAAIKKSNWAEVQRLATHISDPIVHIYLLLKGAEAAVKTSKTTKAITAELLNEATRLTDKLDASESKTKLQIVVAGIFYKSGDTIRGGQTLAAAVRELNSDKPYTDKQSYFALDVYKNHNVSLVIQDWDFDSSFKEAASKDWEGALMLIEGIQLPKLRLSAQIAAAQALFAPSK